MSTGTSVTDDTLAFARALDGLSDEALVRPWPEPSPAGTLWAGYERSTRDVAFRVYQQLRDLAATILATRPPRGEAQIILAQHQLAWRDLTGALAGVDDDLFDRVPAEGEWPLRTVIEHMAGAERGFHALIHWAVRRAREGGAAPIEMPSGFRDEVSAPFDPSGPAITVIERCAALHARVLADFAALNDDDLAAENIWWEGQVIPVRFRLHRFDTHLREHTIQVDKTLALLGRPPSEAARQARLLHRALGEVEGAAIGAPEVAVELQDTVRSDIAGLTATLAR